MYAFKVSALPVRATIASPRQLGRVKKGGRLTARFSCAPARAICTASAAGQRVESGDLLPTSKAGTYSLVVAATTKPRGGSIARRTYVVDDTPPFIATQSLLASYAVGMKLTLTWICRAPDVASCNASFGGTILRSGITPITVHAGTDTITVTAKDTVGNTATKIVTFTGDSTPPAISIATPAANATFVLGQVMTPMYSCGSNAVRCVATPIGTSAIGAYVFTVVAADAAGNVASSSVDYTVAAPPPPPPPPPSPPPPPPDTTGPSITIESPGDGQTYVLGRTYAAAYRCTDDSDVATCNGPVANGAPIDTSTTGTHTFTVDATDSHGNWSRKDRQLYGRPRPTRSGDHDHQSDRRRDVHARGHVPRRVQLQRPRRGCDLRRPGRKRRADRHVDHRHSHLHRHGHGLARQYLEQNRHLHCQLNRL